MFLFLVLDESHSQGLFFCCPLYAEITFPDHEENCRYERYVHSLGGIGLQMTGEHVIMAVGKENAIRPSWPPCFLS